VNASSAASFTLPHAAPPKGRADPSRRQSSRDGFAALALAARLHGVSADPETLAHAGGLGADENVTTRDLLIAARQLGLRARAVRSSATRLASTPLPALATVRGTDGTEHRVVLAQCDGNRVLQVDPSSPGASGPAIETLAAFTARWTGELVLLARRSAAISTPGTFNLRWFAPAIWKHRALLGEVLLMTLFLQILALVSPLFFQVVMDKVLVHRAVSTLDVLVLGLLVVVCFETLLGALRSFVFSHTTHRIDVELGARLFRHLLSLPLAYFQVRRVGDSVARVRELENIRNFLTGQSMTIVLDLAFSIVYFAVMMVYSPTLTLIVVASLPLYAGLSLLVMPLLRARLEQQFARGAEGQALLVESVTSIETVKAGALEPQFARRWEDQLSAYVRACFGARTVATWANEGIALIGKLVQAALLWWGAHAVMAGGLTVGEFVAFNLFAQRVAQPVMRLAQFWTDFQQTGISLERLGDILNTPTEARPAQGTSWPSIRGQVDFDQVSFRYRPEGAPVLDGIKLRVRAGEVIGIVGRSGCGKSTLAKLIQRLHAPEGGRVLIDGIDLALVDPGRLRQQIGVVLQDSRLFHRSVRDNIAVTDPAAPLSAVIAAARLSGAHDFIQELAQGYDTLVGEHGVSLSGGQRQRIAIARTLFANPRILILDEATSALDYESEAALHRNMRHICAGRTVFIIAHRLSSVRHADRIVVMERGRIVESGRHDALMGQPQSLYARLWRLQLAGAPMEDPA
jgi:ATP-binding cassette, subfamily B, bacterial HlyB/CyaB